MDESCSETDTETVIQHQPLTTDDKIDEGLLTDASEAYHKFESSSRVSDDAISFRKHILNSIKRWWGDLEPASSWALLFFAIIPINIINGIDWAAFPVYYVAYAEYFADESRYSIGIIVALRDTFNCCFGIVTSTLIKRYGCFTTMYLSGLFLTVGLFLSSFAPNILMLYVTQGIMSGIAQSLNYITANYMLQKNFNTNRGLGNGIGLLGYTVGNAAGVLILDILVANFGWRGCLLIHSGIAAHLIMLSMLASAIRPDLMKECSKPNENKHGSNRCSQLLSFLKDVFDFTLFKEVTFILICFGMMTYFWSQTNYFQQMPSRAVSLGFTRSDGAELVAASFVIATLIRLLITGISNINCVNRVLLYNSGYAIAAAGDFTIATFDSYLGQWIGAALYGVTTGVTDTMECVMMVDLFGVNRLARCLALVYITRLLVAVAAAPVGGYLYDVTGNYDATFLLAGSLVTFGGFLVLIVVIVDVFRRKRPNKEDPES